MSHVILGGWCTDPYVLHEARWLSDDKPTKLVFEMAAPLLTKSLLTHPSIAP